MASARIFAVPSGPEFPLQFTVESQTALNLSQSTPLPTPTEIGLTQEECNPVLIAWDTDIRRAARSAAVRFQLDESYADDFAQEARIRLANVLQRHPVVPEGYLRRVISNAIQSAVSATRQWSGNASIDEVANELESNTGTTAASADPLKVAAVVEFVNNLPANRRRVYELIYEQGCTQREAASQLGVAQPRVAQMHRELLYRAWHELGHLQDGAESRAA